MILVFAVGTLTACGSKLIKPPLAGEYCIGRDYELVESSFAGAGFTNISKTALEDLGVTEYGKAGTLKQISIDGKSNYSTEDTFSPESMIVIEYHSMKTIIAPISSNDVKSKDVEAVAQLFKDTGFNNVAIKDVYDLDPDTFDAEFENEVLIDGVSIFDTDDKFLINANISIIHHLPYKKYTVQMNIDFIENLIFNKYDVNLLIDGKKQHTLKHGTDADYIFRLTDGEYTFTFESSDSSSVKGQAIIDVKSDVDASYKISCSSDKVAVQTIFIDAKKDLAENESKIMSTERGFIGANYNNVVTSLKELGFTNIKEVPIYDIILGITKPGSTKSVSIGGTNSYKRGDVFTTDIEIIVKYSLHVDDDPAKKSSESITSGNQTYRTETYARINFNIPSSWDSKLEGDGRMLYYPAVKETTGFIQCNFMESEIGNVNEAEAKLLLKGGIDGLVSMLQDKVGITQVKSTNYLKLGNQHAVRVCCYVDTKDNDINNDTKMVFDVVMVLFSDGFSEITAIFTPTEYEGTYKSEIEKVLSSVVTIDKVETSTTEFSNEDKKAIELASSKIIIELVIQDINDILGERVITDYSINQRTGYVSFNMTYDFTIMNKQQQQIWLDSINKVLYTQIVGADVPYTRYRYFIGETEIAENKTSDPYSVKLK